MFVHGDEGLTVLKGNVKNTMLGDRGWNPVPAVLAMPSTPRGSWGQRLDLWAHPVPLSLGLITPHLGDLDVSCPLYTHFVQEHSGQGPRSSSTSVYHHLRNKNQKSGEMVCGCYVRQDTGDSS